MQMTGQRTLPVPPQQAWDALNDPEMLKACIPGCESIVATEPNRYELVMAARAGGIRRPQGRSGKLGAAGASEPRGPLLVEALLAKRRPRVV